MKKLNIDLLGWIAAATLAGILASSGFQATTESFAVCDLQKVIRGSDVYKVEEAKFQAKVNVRQDLLKFISENRVIAADEWAKLRDLSVKENANDAEKADLAKLKQTITEHSKKMTELQGKHPPTADEVNVLQEYQTRYAQASKSAESLRDEYSRDIPLLQDQAAKTVEDLARTACQAIGKEQGYTLVFDMLAAPYGAHDITDATLVRMNKK